MAAGDGPGPIPVLIRLLAEGTLAEGDRRRRELWCIASQLAVRSATASAVVCVATHGDALKAIPVGALLSSAVYTRVGEDYRVLPLPQ